VNLPIQFPSNTEVIREEVTRFRALSPVDQVRELDESFRTYHFLRAASGRAEAIDQLAEEDEHAARKAITEFAARHG